MNTVLGFLGLILGPPLIGLLLGLVQSAAYRLAVVAHLIAAERVPPFPILWLRGLVAVVAIAAALGIWSVVGRPAH
jgi:hypothetical protein